MKKYDSRQLSLTWIPAAGAVITGLLAGLACFAVAHLVEYAHAVELAGAVGAVAALLAWFAFRSQAVELFRALNDIQPPTPPPASVEEVKPQVYEATVRVNLLQENGRAGSFIDLPARPEQLRALADGLSHGKQFSQGTWTGAGQPFSRSEFESLRGELLRRGLAQWNNSRAPAQGASLTHAGKAVLRHFESETTPPPGPGLSKR